MTHVESWGRHFHYDHTVKPLTEPKLPKIAGASQNSSGALAHGMGRSYGDSCLNDQGLLLPTAGLDHYLSFDAASGILRCQAGVTLKQVLETFVPRGYFLPVVPGTQFVTIGGAIANDIHGKNHHRAGTFGCHVRSLDLIRSDQPESPLRCSPQENSELFAATIGGLGLTGLIVSAEIQLIPISSGATDVDEIKFRSFDEFKELSEESDRDFPYTVAWIDTFDRGPRGILIRGDHAKQSTKESHGASFPLAVPFECPAFLLNPWSIQAFNTAYFHKRRRRHSRFTSSYQPFFFPLDRILGWNRMYGRDGFFQFQCVVPMDQSETLRSILRDIAQQRRASFLAVLKTFGEKESPGMLSFPQPGFTLTLDFANRGQGTRSMIQELNERVVRHGGRLYPAKDSLMTAPQYQQSYPNLEKFLRWKDPAFSSSFWRRVTSSLG